MLRKQLILPSGVMSHRTSKYIYIYDQTVHQLVKMQDGASPVIKTNRAVHQSTLLAWVDVTVQRRGARIS